MLTKELEMPELLALSYSLIEKKFGFILTSPQIPVKEQVGVSSGPVEGQVKAAPISLFSPLEYMDVTSWQKWFVRCVKKNSGP